MGDGCFLHGLLSHPGDQVPNCLQLLVSTALCPAEPFSHPNAQSSVFLPDPPSLVSQFFSCLHSRTSPDSESLLLRLREEAWLQSCYMVSLETWVAPISEAVKTELYVHQTISIFPGI